MEFSRQEYWSRLPVLPPGDLPDPGIEPISYVSCIGGELMCGISTMLHIELTLGLKHFSQLLFFSKLYELKDTVNNLLSDINIQLDLC